MLSIKDFPYWYNNGHTTHEGEVLNIMGYTKRSMKKRSIFTNKCKAITTVLTLIIVVLIFYIELPVPKQSEKTEAGFSEPLFENYTKDDTPTLNDYLTFTSFSKDTIQDFLFYFGIQDDHMNKYIFKFIYLHNTPIIENNYYIVFFEINGSGKASYSGITKFDISQSEIIFNTDEINIMIYPINSTSILISDMLNMTLKFEGKVFWYNNGKVAHVTPKGFLNGFELIGDVRGEINGRKVEGHGYFERINFNIKVTNTPYIEDWNVFSTDNIKGLVYSQGVYKDGCVWINNKYYKPIDFFTTNTQYDNKLILNKEIIIYLNISGSVKCMRITMDYLGYDPISEFYSLKINLDGKSYFGFGFIDSTLIRNRM